MNFLQRCSRAGPGPLEGRPQRGLERKGAETVVADMFDLDQLLAAMRGTRRAYYLPFYHPYMIQSATAFAVAAQEAKLEAVVSMGQWLASPIHPSLATRQTWLADQVLSVVPGLDSNDLSYPDGS